MRLGEINEYIQGICENIARVLEVEVTLVDDDLTRIAGTGSFAGKIGTKIDKNSIYSHVLENGECYIMDEKYASENCKSCNQKESCKEVADICCPIKLEEKVLGVLGLVAFHEEQKSIMLEKKDELLTFIFSMSELISLKYEEAFMELTDKDFHKEVRTFEELEKEEIIKALKNYGGTTEGMKKTAEALNIGIATLYRKVKKYKIKNAEDM